MTRRAPLELAFVPRGVEEPLLGYYSVTPLTPGGWADLLGDVGLPDTLRRLSQTVAVGDSHRTVEMRCLEMLPAMAHLLTERDGPSSASVRAWRLAARVVEQSVLAGGDAPDLGRFAAAFPAAGHAVLIRDEEGEARTERPRRTRSRGSSTPRRARFRRRCATHGSCARPRRTPTSSTWGCSSLSCGRCAPDLGLAPPLVRLTDTLAPLRLRLEAAPDSDAGWPLHVDPADQAILQARRLGSSRRSHAPATGHVTLGQQGVVELRLAASALEFAGAAVELPPELVEEQDLEHDAAYLEFAPGALSLGGVVRYDLRASLGGREISAEEFQALAAATQPLVRIGGEWRALKGRALARAKALAAIALHGSSMPAMTALGAALAGRYEVRGHGGGGRRSRAGSSSSWSAACAGRSCVAPVEPPEAFQGELRPYQKVGLGWLSQTRELGLGALLADDMGLGKTVQVIAYLLDHADGVKRPALIVCPTSVLGNWQRELRRFAPDLAVHIHHGPDRTRERRGARGLGRRPHVVCAPAARPPPPDGRVEWRVLVLDEAQAVKNPLTHAAQTAQAGERPGTGWPSPARRSRTGSTTCGRSCTS